MPPRGTKGIDEPLPSLARLGIKVMMGILQPPPAKESGLHYQGAIS